MSMLPQIWSVGYVTWRGHTKAELFADGSWWIVCDGEDEPQFARCLASHYAGWDRHPGFHYGQGILPNLARLMEGEFVLHPPPPSGPDVVH